MRDDIEVGDILGKGAFGKIEAIQSIKHHYPSADSAENCSHESSHEGDRDGNKVIKRLKSSLKKSTRDIAAKDLALESRFLHKFNHPNIIKLCGEGSNPGSLNFFLVLERIEKTLSHQILQWRHDEYIRNQNQTNQMQQLSILQDISSAMTYIHEQNVIYRDLKPDNIGLNHCNVAKLFDFGLAKELDLKDKVNEDQYKLTGCCGSRRYMAYEVASYKPYGHPADVYSFGIVAYEMWCLEQIWKNESIESHYQKAYVERRRPTMKRSVPLSIRKLIQSCWLHEPSARPQFSDIQNELQACKIDFTKKSNYLRNLNLMKCLKHSQRQNN